MGRMVFVTRESMPIWGKAVDDDNPIHTDVETAKAVGFVDTPVHGTRIAAYPEQDVLDKLKKINRIRKNEKKDPLVYVGQTIQFHGALYPEILAEWTFNYDRTKAVNGNELDIKISLVSEEKELAWGVVNLGLARPSISSETLDSFLDSENKAIVKRRTTRMDSDELINSKLENFCECIGGWFGQGIPIMYIGAGIPAALLELLPREEEKKTKKKIPMGGYSSMRLEFYNQPTIGSFDTIIKKVSAPKKKENNYFYGFEAICLQKNISILSGKVRCYTQKEIKI